MFNFDRRINGITYYCGFLVVLLFFLISYGLVTLLVDIDPNHGKLFQTGSTVDWVVGAIAVIVYLAVFIAFFYGLVSIIRQRANDINDKYAVWLTLVVFFNPLVLLFGLIPSQAGKNKYGHKPANGVDLIPK